MSENKISVVGAPAIDLEASISADLASRDTPEETEVLQSEEVKPAFDIASLSHDQLQALKAAIAATPDRVDQKHVNNTIKVRMIDGKLVVDFKNAFLGMIMDETLQRKVERHIIPVLLEGETEFKNMMYRDFMQGEQVVCEVIDMIPKTTPVVEGQTYDPFGQLVEMVRTEVTYKMNVKKPDGKMIELPGKISNA